MVQPATELAVAVGVLQRLTCVGRAADARPSCGRKGVPRAEEWREQSRFLLAFVFPSLVAINGVAASQ
jgi:hypothetical protein